METIKTFACKTALITCSTLIQTNHSLESKTNHKEWEKICPCTSEASPQPSSVILACTSMLISTSCSLQLVANSQKNQGINSPKPKNKSHRTHFLDSESITKMREDIYTLIHAQTDIHLKEPVLKDLHINQCSTIFNLVVHLVTNSQKRENLHTVIKLSKTKTEACPQTKTTKKRTH